MTDGKNLHFFFFLVLSLLCVVFFVLDVVVVFFFKSVSDPTTFSFLVGFPLELFLCFLLAEKKVAVMWVLGFGFILLFHGVGVAVFLFFMVGVFVSLRNDVGVVYAFCWC